MKKIRVYYSNELDTLYIVSPTYKIERFNDSTGAFDLSNYQGKSHFSDLRIIFKLQFLGEL